MPFVAFVGFVVRGPRLRASGFTGNWGLGGTLALIRIGQRPMVGLGGRKREQGGHTSREGASS